MHPFPFSRHVRSGVISGEDTGSVQQGNSHLLRGFVGLCIITFLLGLFAGCGPSPDSREDGTVYVVATTGMIADAARNIGGEHVRVDGLMGPGVDPHTYKATSADARKLARADIVLYNGLNLEGEMQDILKKMGRRKPTYAVTEDVPKEKIIKPRSDIYVYDPHLWFDVKLWSRALSTIKTAFTKYDPDHSSVYENQYKAFRKKLVELDQWAKRQIKTIPEKSRVLVTAHDAFAYFGQAYNVRVEALQGISTQSGIGLKDREQLADLIVENNIRAIFLESSVPRKSIQSVIETCRSRGHAVSIGGELFSDAMGPRGSPEGKYIGMVRHNVRTIVSSLTDSDEQEDETE